MDEQTKQAFSLATELTKQLLTLATGTVAITISFAKDIAPKSTLVPRWFLAGGWGLQTLSIVFGLLTLGALAGTAGKKPPEVPADPERRGSPPAPHIYRQNVLIVSIGQFVLFGLGTVCLVVAAMLALWSAQP